MAKTVRYNIGNGGDEVLGASTQRELVRALHMLALASVTRKYGFIARKTVNGSVTDRYEVNVSVSLKKQK